MAGTLILASLCATSWTAQGSSAGPEPRVTIDTGPLAGSRERGVLSFRGIPFARPPIGPLRWRAPQPVVPWTNLRPAKAYGHDCMQLPFPSDAAPLGTTPSEDCLYLNVWRPAGHAAKLPVMVWIHGGGFVNGGASPPTYSGEALARRGIVFVSINYRLGRFGTFAHPRLTRENADGGLLANYGYMDQIAGLRWVRRNIAAFGGDPRAVTLVGESAGGMSIHALLTSPMTKGLFARAVIQSGGPQPAPLPDLAAAERVGVSFAASQGIASDDPMALAKLRALDAKRVVDGLNLNALFTPPSGARTFTGPILDGRVAVDPWVAYDDGRFARVPVMVGATSDDIGGAGGYMASGARRVADLFTRARVPTYYYRFGYVATSLRTPRTRGAGHATDIPFFLDTAAVKYGDETSPADRAAAALASGYLINFVRTGDPNGRGLPSWPRVTPERRKMMSLDASGGGSATIDPSPSSGSAQR